MTASRLHALFVPLLAVGMGGLVLTAGSAAAIYMITPLTLTPSAYEAEVGDELSFEVAPNRDHEGESLAGRNVTVRYGWDTAENQTRAGPPDESTSSDDEQPESTFAMRNATTIELDADSRAAFSWTVPAEVDDRNVEVSLVSESGDVVATVHLVIGDAEPMMRIMAESGPAPEPATGEAPAEPATGAPADDGAATTDDAAANGGSVDAGEKNTVPAAGFVAAVAGLAAAALVIGRRR